MTLNSTTTVREVAAAMPQSTRIFEKFKIDYCCGGATPLVEACANAGVDFEELERMIEEAATAGQQGQATNDFQQTTLPELIDHIVTTHHCFTRDEMARLQPLFDKVVSVHGENHPELRQANTLFKQLCADLTPHMFKEEQILFPYIVQLAKAASHKMPAPLAPFGTVNNPVRMMMMEHDLAGEIVRELRATTNDYTVPPDVCISYKTLYEALAAFEQDLHQHIHLENNILFPRAIKTEDLACRS
ncbi:MAG TPA: iron-sulfur cluster repair di-iron protein [Pyrinomonadaceae bacterium]|nr:iron-sulfur cluster repair di-iron protein [Pyrinomonadaceae bacterium]